MGPGNPRNQTLPHILKGGGLRWGHYYNIPSTQLLTNGTCTKWQAKNCEQLRLERPPRKTKSDEGKERKGGGLTTTTHMGLIHALRKQW